MKAPAFSYKRASCIEAALDVLAVYGDRAKVLAGGQSLLPAMNLRLLTPELIVDIGSMTELRSIAVHGATLRIGALTRHVDILRSAAIAAHAPLLSAAVAHIGHPAVRNRGTIGGSLAHADPASELPACMLALRATMIVREKRGERRIAASEFFRGIFQTALSSNELLVAIEIPVAPKHSRSFFHELARRHGDYAIAGVAAHALVERDLFSTLQLAFFGTGDRPVLASAAARKLVEVPITPPLVSDACAEVGKELDFLGDQQASSAVRRHLAKVLLARCIAALLNRPELAVGAA